ncbi:GT99 family glycosyltransferase N-terminal domain-containing protein [Paraburkholderia sp. RL17-347-BIC-D]|uniref:GT99 family glycosyltransferase N-terminal domain-containing protein n=1 Tax=Paraburkholderia sp. RL17-347-BIC-D TaxID=3031632 RepID=UPI0038B77400
MLAAFLPPYPFRGVRAPYLWLYYRLLTEWAGESALFITGRDYVRPSQEWKNRWECDPDMQSRLGYSLPDDPLLPDHHYAWLDESRFEQWVTAAGQNPIAAFRRFLTERDSEFEQELRRLLAAAPAPVEAIATICNVPALEAVCADLAIPVIHVELGALRGPIFWETSYLDFQGVNGDTESASRYDAFEGWSLSLARSDLLRFFTRAWSFLQSDDRQPDHELGTVLQVEDDSNLVAFGNGMDNIGLLTIATQQMAGDGECPLVRPHPGSSFSIRSGRFDVDDSPNSLSFIQRCQRIMTINSSVGLEAILLNKPVNVFGESSFNFILAARDERELIRRLGFYLFAYLVPFSLQLAPEYLRFRLSKPAEESIVLYHLDEYLKQRNLDTKMFADSSGAERVELSVLIANQAKVYEEALAERAGQISTMTQALAERDGQLSALTQAMSECDGQLSALMQAVSERDGQLSALTQALAERDGQLSVLTHAVSERDKKIEALLSSTSWRMTKIVRFFGRLLRGTARRTSSG